MRMAIRTSATMDERTRLDGFEIQDSKDATGLPRGVSRLRLFSWEREPPRDKPVASSFFLNTIGVATSVRFHGTSPWHL